MNAVAQKYAAGLWGAARELDCAGAVADELGGMTGMMAQLSQSLRGTPVAGAVLSGLLREALAGKVHPLTLEFVLLLQARRHLRHFAGAALHFRELCGKAAPVVSLRVSYAPDGATLARLKARFVQDRLLPAERAGDASFAVTVDGSLLGGFVAGYAGYQLDASLKTALEKMKRA